MPELTLWVRSRPCTLVNFTSSHTQCRIHVAVDRHIGEIVPRLLKRFASREGYKLFDDTLPCCMCKFDLLSRRS